MRLIIFTNRDIASNLFLNHVLPHIAQYVVHIFVSDKVGKTTTLATPKELKDLKFFEQTLPNEFIFPLLDNQNRIYTEGGKLMTFNELSRHYKVPIESLNDVRSTENLDKVKNLAPDLVLSIRLWKDIRKRLFDYSDTRRYQFTFRKTPAVSRRFANISRFDE